MKKLICIVFCSLLLSTKAQTVNYKVTEDDPKNVTNASINIDLAHLDFGGGNINGTSLNCGVWGHALYNNRIGVDYTIRYGWFTFGKVLDGQKDLASNLNIQLGGMLVFSQREKVGKSPIVLKSSTSGKYTYVTSIKVPSTTFKYTGLRGGLYFKRNLMEYEKANGGSTYTNYYIFGLYGGIAFGSASKVKIQTDSYGQKGRSHHLRTSLDLLITPFNNADSAKFKSPLGGRLLIQAIPSIRKKENKRMYNSRVSGEMELGYRMVDGWYIAATISIPITRNVKALGYKEPESSKRTAE